MLGQLSFVVFSEREDIERVIMILPCAMPDIETLRCNKFGFLKGILSAQPY